MKPHQILVFCIVLFCGSVTAQLNDEQTTAFQDHLFDLIDFDDVVGVSAAVYIGDDIWTGTAGQDSKDLLLQPETALGMGSCMMTITSAAIFKLNETQLLQLSDTIGQYLPDYANIDPSITINQLLNHSSGIFDFVNHPQFFNAAFTEQIYNTQDVIEGFVLAPIFSPGEQQLLSHTNYLLLGEIITSVTQEPYLDYIRETFDVAERYPSMLSVPDELQSSELAHLWLDLDNDSEPDDITLFNLFTDALFSAHGAAGSLSTTPEDLVKWTYDLYKGLLLEPATMDLLLDFEGNIGAGVFSSSTNCVDTVFGHSGVIIYTATMYYVPELDIAVAVMSNDGTQALTTITEEIAKELICLYGELKTDTALEENNQVGLDVYPNPFENYINVSSDNWASGKSYISIYDALGSVHYRTEENIINTVQIMTNLPAGVYFLTITGNDFTFIQKIISQKP